MRGSRRLVYTAQSKHFFYCRDAVCEFAFNEGVVPLNPFRAFDYFLGDRVDRDIVRDANRRLIEASDEVWVFGNVADGVIFEIALAGRLGKPVRFHSIHDRAREIHQILPNCIRFENEVLTLSGLDEPQIRQHILNESLDAVIRALGRTRELSGT